MEGAQVEGLELREEWLSPQVFVASLGLRVLRKINSDLRVQPLTLQSTDWLSAQESVSHTLSQQHLPLGHRCRYIWARVHV